MQKCVYIFSVRPFSLSRVHEILEQALIHVKNFEGAYIHQKGAGTKGELCDSQGQKFNTAGKSVIGILQRDDGTCEMEGVW